MQLSRVDCKPILAVFAQRVADYPFVRGVYGGVGDESIRLWTVLSTDDRDDRGTIYEEEGRMFDEHPDIQFDFFVLCLPRLKKPLSETIPAGFDLVSGGR